MQHPTLDPDRVDNCRRLTWYHPPGEPVRWMAECSACGAEAGSLPVYAAPAARIITDRWIRGHQCPNPTGGGWIPVSRRGRSRVRVFAGLQDITERTLNRGTE